ncbi:hypothetical protein ACVIIW_004431 [Bradyrhizobium sp. USDA 4449]
MPLTTDNRCWPEALISSAYSLRVARGEHQGLLLRDHVGEADDGVERRAQLVAHRGEEARLGGIGGFRRAARLVERLLRELAIRDIAHHGDDFGLAREIPTEILIERPAAHLDPDEVDLATLGAIRLPPQPEFDAAHLAARGVRQRREIGRTIGDMDTIEQAMALQLCDGHAEHGFRRRRDELHRAIALMPRDHVAHVARQQAIALLLARQQRDAGAGERLGAEGKACGIERCRSNAERHHHAAFRAAEIAGRQPAELAEQDQQARAGQREHRCKGGDATRGRQRGLQGNHDQPDRSE